MNTNQSKLQGQNIDTESSSIDRQLPFLGCYFYSFANKNGLMVCVLFSDAEEYRKNELSHAEIYGKWFANNSQSCLGWCSVFLLMENGPTTREHYTKAPSCSSKNRSDHHPSHLMHLDTSLVRGASRLMDIPNNFDGYRSLQSMGTPQMCTVTP